ncbi:hypothetical protein QIA30_06225 (plasmid) [Borreliella turdi]
MPEHKISDQLPTEEKIKDNLEELIKENYEKNLLRKLKSYFDY